jgi:molybdopterin/thiamine biosynthesis adenylyltransferase
MSTTGSTAGLRPVLFDTGRAIKSGQLRFLRNGTACLRDASKRTIKIPKERQYDLTRATMFGLNERLTSAATSPRMNSDGETLRDLFNREWERYTKALLEESESGISRYGIYAYYEEEGTLVHYCPEFWHRTVAVASSSKLLADPKGALSWREIREIFENTTIAVAGGSVGNMVLHTAVMDIRPRWVKIADKSLYKMENINRVRLRYDDIVASRASQTQAEGLSLRNKAEVTARQLYAIDPFIYIAVYTEGIHDATIERFFAGGKGEPPADIIVEEVDEPRIKIILREEARKRRLPLIMVSDLGSVVQLDVRRFDLDPSLPLSFGVSDDNLHKATEAIYEQGGDRNAFFGFVDALIGTSYRTDELGAILAHKTEIPTATIIPQLGSTAAMAGGIAAETIARIRLGFEYPERVTINKRTFEVVIHR